MRWLWLCLLILALPCSGTILSSNRIAPWLGNVGIPGGIPIRTNIFVNVLTTTNTSYLCAGNGATDDTTKLQAALNACPSNQVVYLPAGNYKVTSPLTIHNSLTLRGAGFNSTTISIYWSGGNLPSGIELISNRTPVLISTNNITNGFTQGTFSIGVSNVTGLAVSDHMMLSLNDDGIDSTNYGNGGTCFACGVLNPDGTHRTMGQMVEVTNITGTTIMFTPPLYFDYPTNRVPQAAYMHLLQYAGLEDLTVDMTNTINLSQSVEMDWCAYCWVKNCQLAMCQTVNYRPEFSYRCEVRECFVHHQHNYGAGQDGAISFATMSSGCLIENNILDYIHAPLIVVWGSSGNVFGYNYVVHPTYNPTNWLPPSMSMHGGTPAYNLWEGNSGTQISSDNTWGPSIYQTFFRNEAHCKGDPSITDNVRAVVLCTGSHYHNLVGNVLGFTNWPGVYQYVATNAADIHNPAILQFGYWSVVDHAPFTSPDFAVTNTLILHGNWDYFNNAIVWDSTNADHVLPNSYYLDSAPTWWNNWGGTPWPPIGPDLSPMVSKLPAQMRYESMTNLFTASVRGVTLKNGATLR